MWNYVIQLQQIQSNAKLKETDIKQQHLSNDTLPILNVIQYDLKTESLKTTFIGFTCKSLGTNPESTAARVAPTKQKRRKECQTVSKKKKMQ